MPGRPTRSVVAVFIGLLVGTAIVAFTQRHGGGSHEDVVLASTAEQERQIEHLMTHYFAALESRDYQGAYDLLSRPRRDALRQEGVSFEEWSGLEAALEAPFLRVNPDGIKVRIDGTEPGDDGATRVLVTGVGWKAPGSPCRQRRGLTWVREEDGAEGNWRYEPGFSTVPSRAEVWGDDDMSLFGVGCDVSDQVQDTVYSYFTALTAGDYDAAWNLLTPAAQRRFGSRREWMRANARNYSPYLVIGDISVVPQAAESGRELRVGVTGIRWLGAGCKEFSGATWVTRLAAGWRYDPGHGKLPAGTPQIGAGCAPLNRG